MTNAADKLAEAVRAFLAKAYDECAECRDLQAAINAYDTEKAREVVVCRGVFHVYDPEVGGGHIQGETWQTLVPSGVLTNDDDGKQFEVILREVKS